MRILGTTKTSKDNKITIIQQVADILNVGQGDMVAFCDDGKGNIVLKKATISI